MAFPVRDTLNIAADRPGQPWPSDLGHARSAPADAVAEADDLERLQSCLDWLNRERMTLAGQTADRIRPGRLPRAAQLGPVPGISARTKAPERKRESVPFVLSPPLASERLQAPLAGRSRISGAVLLVLIAAALAGSIAYQLSEGSFPLPGVALAAPLDRP
jgi:hypothetical protein